MSAQPAKRIGPVLELLLTRLWQKKLARDGLGEVPVVDDLIHRATSRVRRQAGGWSMRPARSVVPRDERAEYYRLLDLGKWEIEDPTDRQIAFLLADGASFRGVMREVKVGQFRVERVLCELVKGRQEPWHWRQGKPRAGSRSPLRRRLQARRMVRP